MSTDIDWQHELDSSFGAGHDLPPAHYVAAGRTAVRRRRATAALLTAALVIGGSAAWASGQGSAVRGDAPVATSGADAREREVTVPDDEPERLDRRVKQLEKMRAQPWRKGDPPARSSPDGIQVRDGAVVHERRDDLYPGKDTRSAALDLSYEGERWWVLLEWDKGGSSMASERPTDEWHASFDAFVASATSGGGMTSGPVEDSTYMYGDLVNWSGGEPEIRPGATLVRTVQDPLASSKDSIGLAVEFEGEITWLAIMRKKGGAAATYEEAARSGWTTFDQWLSEWVALQTGEPGLRLIELDVDGTVSPALAGVEIIDQQADPDLPSYGTDTAVASAIALVSWQGERWFVLALMLPDQDSVTTFAAAKTEGAETIAEFIDFAESRADGEGMR
jgi:hypothetical protein